MKLRSEGCAMFPKIILLVTVFVVLTACTAPAISPSLTIIPTLGGQELTLTPTQPVIVPSETPTSTPEPTATAEEVGVFTPANTIEFSESLPNYDLALAPDADKKGIYNDGLVNQLIFAISPSIPENRAVLEKVLQENPAWEGIGPGADYNERLAFMKAFLEISGGTMIVQNHNFEKFEADLNLPVGFEVEEVDKLSPSTANFLALGNGGDYSRGGGGIMYVNEEGQLIYKVEIVDNALESALNDERYIYNAWDWTAGEVISDLFRQTIAATSFKDKNSTTFKYQLYTKGGVPKSGTYYADTYWTFLKSK